MIKAVVIDDEPNAIELIKGYINKIPFIECTESFRDPVQAIIYLKEHQVDLIFLDINMPHLSGISLLKTLKNPPRIILTTAYAEYAVESYEYQVTDYLLKPISFERFLKAILKIKSEYVSENTSIENSENFVFVKSGQQQYKLKIEDILYLQKEGNYITYFLKDKKILARQSIKEALNGLNHKFIQIHKSTIINLVHISFFDSSSVTIQDVKLSIGQSYKVTLMELLKRK